MSAKPKKWPAKLLPWVVPLLFALDRVRSLFGVWDEVDSFIDRVRNTGPVLDFLLSPIGQLAIIILSILLASGIPRRLATWVRNLSNDPSEEPAPTQVIVKDMPITKPSLEDDIDGAVGILDTDFTNAFEKAYKEIGPDVFEQAHVEDVLNPRADGRKRSMDSPAWIRSLKPDEEPIGARAVSRLKRAGLVEAVEYGPGGVVPIGRNRLDYRYRWTPLAEHVAKRLGKSLGKRLAQPTSGSRHVADHPEPRDVGHAPPRGFSKAVREMPDLLSAMKRNLELEEARLVREFVVIPNKNYMFNPPNRLFGFYGDDFRDLQEKVDLLETLGLVTIRRYGKPNYYRMTEEFVEALLTSPDLNQDEATRNSGNSTWLMDS